jgi:hypothetical protein
MMMHRPHRAILATPVLALGIGLATVTAPATTQQAGKGLTVTMTTTMTTSASPAPQVFTIVKAQVSSSGKARADYLPDGSKPDATPTPNVNVNPNQPPLLKVGTYSLGKRDGDTTYIIDPTQKKIWVMLKSDNAATQAATNKIVNEQYTDVDVSAQRIMPDSVIEGIAVQHWRVLDSHTSKSHFMTSTNTTIAKSHYEIYTAPDYNLGTANGFSTGTFAAATGGDTSYSRKITAAMVQATHGLPLLMQIQMQMLTGQGKPIAFSMAMRASNISHGDPPASTFVMPTGYTMVRASFGRGVQPGAPPGLGGAKPAATGASSATGATGGIPTYAGPTGDTTHKPSLDSLVNKQAGAGVTNAIQQKIKSPIHFP